MQHKFYNYYGGVSETFEEFKNTLLKYDCLVFNNSSNSVNINEVVFYINKSDLELL